MSGVTDAELEALESVLGLSLPADVRSKYLESGGLLGPTDCHLLYPFETNIEHSHIVEINGLRSEDWFPRAFASTVFVGDDGCGNLVGYDWSKERAVLWNPADGGQIQEQAATVSEMWEIVRNLYVEADSLAPPGPLR